jgi:hypothetical protein
MLGSRDGSTLVPKKEMAPVCNICIIDLTLCIT